MLDYINYIIIVFGNILIPILHIHANMQALQKETCLFINILCLCDHHDRDSDTEYSVVQSSDHRPLS